MRVIIFLITIYQISFLIFACTNSDKFTDNKSDTPSKKDITIELAFPNLSFTRPVDLQHPNGHTNKLFVLEQKGIIYFFDNNTAVTEKTVFLDIRGRVDDRFNEEGLLGLAFHPSFSNNGYFIVNYTASSPDRTVISRFYASSASEADPDSELILLEYEQPYSNHNGGQISFGSDGYLYIAVGDGGSANDPHNNGQNLRTLLGSILRIDVDRQENGLPYSIPTDNPFADNQEGYREEIYAYGLRNPWRFSFDPETNWLWTGDVGQNQYEEINIIEKGGNYGWKYKEGFHDFSGSTTSELIDPIWEYNHSNGDVSITGGFVYRGNSATALFGKYIYADYASGRIWSLDFSDPEHPTNTLIYKADFQISSFGTDQNHELYICGFDGKIYKFTDQ